VWEDADAAADATVTTGAVIEPDPAWVAPYREAGERFRALYPALRDARRGPAVS
jgi:sugar (pentulose or hexulose) kinase